MFQKDKNVLLNQKKLLYTRYLLKYDKPQIYTFVRPVAQYFYFGPLVNRNTSTTGFHCLSLYFSCMLLGGSSCSSFQKVDIATFSGITVTDVQTKNMLSNVCQTTWVTVITFTSPTQFLLDRDFEISLNVTQYFTAFYLMFL